MSLPKWKRHLPNVLTIARIFGVMVGAFLLFSGTHGSTVVAFVVFVVVATTDFLDGYLARKWAVISDFGKLLDPIADKIFLMTLYFCFVGLDVISIWWVIPILLREVLITVIRLRMLLHGSVLAAEQSGKVKTVVQNISVFFLFVFYYLRTFQTGHNLLPIVKGGAYFFLVLAVFLTLYSGLEFFRKNKGCLMYLFSNNLKEDDR